MTDEFPGLDELPPIEPQNRAEVEVAPDGPRQHAYRPYLQVFGPDTGVFEYYLPYRTTRSRASTPRSPWTTASTSSKTRTRTTERR